jgi:hypothetical protein
MKKDKKSKPKKNQEEIHIALEKQGYKVVVCCSFDEFVNVVTNYIG